MTDVSAERPENFEDVMARIIGPGVPPWDPHTYAPWDGTGTPWPVDDGGFPMFPGGPGAMPEFVSFSYTPPGPNVPFGTVTYVTAVVSEAIPLTSDMSAWSKDNNSNNSYRQATLTSVDGITWTGVIQSQNWVPLGRVLFAKHLPSGVMSAQVPHNVVAAPVEFTSFSIVPEGPDIPHEIQILAQATFDPPLAPTVPVHLYSRTMPAGAEVQHGLMAPAPDGITWQGAYPAEDWPLGPYELWARTAGSADPAHIAINIIDAPMLILTIPPEITVEVGVPTVYATRLQNPGEALVGVIETFRFTARDGFPLDLQHITYEYQNDLGEWVLVPLTDDGAGLSGTTTFDVPADFDDAEDVRITFTRGGLYDGISTIESEGVAIAQETYVFNVGTPGFVIVTPADGAVVAPDALVSGSGANPLTAVQLLHKSKGYDRPVDVGNTDANGNWSFIQGYAPITVSPETIKVYQANTGFTPEITVTLAPAEDPPRPTLSALEPATAAIEDADFTVHVHGTGFTEDTVIVWGGGDEPTTFVSATEVTTLVKPSVVTAPTVLDVHVRNADKTSGTLQFTWTSTPSEGWTVAELREFAADHEPPIPIPAGAKKAEILAIILAYLDAHTEEN